MRRVLENRDFNDTTEFVTALNKARLENKRSWIFYIGEVCGLIVKIKSYDTGYLQKLEINGINTAAPMDMSVTQWKDTIAESLERAIAG